MPKALARIANTFRNLLAPKDAGWDEKLIEESYLVEEVLQDWGVFNIGKKDTSGEYEVYEIPREFAKIPRHEVPARFVEHLSHLRKTVILITDMNQHKAVQYEMLFVLPAQLMGLAHAGANAPSAEEVKDVIAEVKNAIEVQLTEDLFQADPRVLKPDNLKEFLRNRFRIQVYLLAAPEKLGTDRFVYLTKRREGGSGAVNFLLNVDQDVPRDEEVLMNELSDVVARNSGQQFEWGPVRSAVYNESYEFFLCAHPRSKVALFLSDVIGQNESHQRSRRVRAANVPGVPSLTKTIDDVAEELRSFASKKLNVLCSNQNFGPIYLQGVSTSFSHHKGKIGLIGYAAPPALRSGWKIPIAPHPSEELFDVLRADELNWFPDFQRKHSFGHARHVNLMVRIAAACEKQKQELWEALCPSGAEGLFSIAMAADNKYRLLRQRGINQEAHFRLASRQAIRSTVSLAPEAYLERLLTEPEWLRQPQENETAADQVLLGDGIFYLAVGLETLGFYLFELSTGSKMKLPHYESNSFQNDFAQTRIFELCEQRGISGLRHANKPTSQGNLFTGRDPQGDAVFVKVYYGEQLDGRDQALRKIWPMLERSDLLPPHIQRLRLDGEYRELAASGERDSKTWLVISHEFQTIEVALEGDPGAEERFKWFKALREFYRKALDAGLSFVDCSADDLILLDDGSTVLLIDYGSYVPAAAYAPDPAPGKDEHRDPALFAWLQAHDPSSQGAALLRAQHFYNQGLLEYRIWTGEICVIPETWDAAVTAAPGAFRSKYEEALAQTAASLEKAALDFHLEADAAKRLVRNVMQRFDADVLRRS